MPDLKSVESVYLVLGFIVPGMIITLVRAQFFTGRVRTLSENVVTYIALTVLYYGLAAPIVEYVLSIREPGRAKIFAWLGLIILLPAAIGFVFGILGQNDIFCRLLHFFGINPVHATPSAWDYAFARLLTDGTAAIKELGIEGWAVGHLKVVENTDQTHNLVVCTLCSCYPHAVLGIQPSWYKKEAYRSRAVREPRTVLAEFGVQLPENVAVKVWDSTAELRYLVLPQRPKGTEGWADNNLARLVTRNSMIGTERDLPIPLTGA